VERQQAFGLLAELAPCFAWEALERGEADRAALHPPGPCDLPVERNVGAECGVLVLKTRGLKRSGRICVRHACTSNVASHVGR
jgi:hypothetical protein